MVAGTDGPRGERRAGTAESRKARLEQSTRMQSPTPLDVRDLFPELQGHLIALVSALSDEEWTHPTACPGWSVQDVTLHLLGVDLGYLSGRRDRYQDPWWRDVTGDTVADLAVFNENWVRAARRLSPRLLCELLAVTGEALSRYHATLDLAALGQPVWWVGPGPAPVWLDIAREYTERWVHQQQIRDAVKQPGLKEPRFLGPVIATFVHALPRALHGAWAPTGTAVRLIVEGDAGGSWIAVRTQDRWFLGIHSGEEAHATVALDGDVAWRLWTRGLSPESVWHQLRASGNPELTARVLEMVSIIA